MTPPEINEAVAEYRAFFDKNGYLPWKAAERLIIIAEDLCRQLK